MEAPVLTLNEFITRELRNPLWFVWNPTGARKIESFETAITAEQYAHFQRRHQHIYGCPICKGARQ